MPSFLASSAVNTAASHLPKIGPGVNIPLVPLRNCLSPGTTGSRDSFPPGAFPLTLRQPQAHSTSTLQVQCTQPNCSYLRAISDENTSKLVQSSQHAGKHQGFYFAISDCSLELSCGSHSSIFSKLHSSTLFQVRVHMWSRRTSSQTPLQERIHT